MPTPSHGELSRFSGIPQAFEETARRFSGRVALTGDGGRGRAYTYQEVLELVRALGASLNLREFRKETEIGVLSENRPEWPIAYFGILAAGKTVVPIDANLKPNEIEYIIEHAGLKVIFCSGRFEGMLAGFNRKLKLLSFEQTSRHSWHRLLDQTANMQIEPPSSTAVLIYTSGTTGTPKAVELTHQNLLSNVESIQLSLHFDEDDIFLSVLPLHHTFEATCGFLVPLLTGASIVYARSLKSREILEDISYSHATVMCGVPLLWEKFNDSIVRKIREAPMGRRMMFQVLYSLSSVGWRFGRKWGRRFFRPLREKGGLDSIRIMVSGSAPLAQRIARFFNLIGFDFLEGYGLTEAAPVLSANRPEDIRFGSVGPPLVGVDIRIADPDETGIGEITARGGNVTPGYRGNAEYTAKLVREGWLHTGDLGCIRDGHLYITGRARNLIVSAAGKNIYPEELEEKLTASPFVLETLVFGRKRENRQGEEVRALIVPDIERFHERFSVDVDNPDMSRVESVIEEEVGKVNKEIATYKRIAGFEIQLSELEKTSTKKVKRFVYN
ncbi:MAG: AMP-binding protein [Candidatus Zixiibacteriota bacterium]|nr:MAG: AMP-binding protein [candidate division Zixibacteria bacterium]